MTRPPKGKDKYLSYYGSLVGYATTLLKDNTYSEDIVQEAFIRFNARTDKEKLDNPESYLKVIVRNLSIDHIRRQRRSLERIDSSVDVEQVLENTSDQEQSMASRQELDIVLSALEDLPAVTRRIVEMHRWEGLKLKEIAEETNLSVTQAHYHLHKGVLHCMKALKKK